jgi:hypothetical protein
MAYVSTPLSDPVGFIVFSILMGSIDQLAYNVLTLSLLSSVIAYPFILIGRWVYGNLKPSVTGHLTNLFLTTLVTSVAFAIVLRLWYFAFGSALISGSAASLAVSFIATAIVAFACVIIGDFLNHKMAMRWQMPEKLTLYVIDLIVCVAFFILVTLAFYTGAVTLW